MAPIHLCRCTGCGAVPWLLRCRESMQRNKMTDADRLTPAKRKRLLKTFGPCPAGYTNDDLERFLDLLYGMYSHVYTATELRHIDISDPFDRSETPRQLKLTELAEWLEALVS